MAIYLRQSRVAGTKEESLRHRRWCSRRRGSCIGGGGGEGPAHGDAARGNYGGMRQRRTGDGVREEGARQRQRRRASGAGKDVRRWAV